MFLLVSLVLAWVMVCIGPSLVAELPQTMGVPSRWLRLFSGAFIAGGAFLAALAIARSFPLMSWKVRFVCEWLPIMWLVTLAAVIRFGGFG
jgi:hypothetical protein